MVLADQNQLYAAYLHFCGQHGVRKPSKAVLALLAEDRASRAARLCREVDSGLQPDEKLDDDGGAAPSVVPLAQRTALALPPFTHLGTRGAMALLDLLAVGCPRLEALDLRNAGGLFDADAFKLAPAGNDVVRRVCAAVASGELPRLTSVDLRGHPLGTAAGSALLELAESVPRVTELLFDTDGVDTRVVAAIKRALEKNRAAAARGDGGAVAPDDDASALHPLVASLRCLDRKTLREQQQLRVLLWSLPAFATLTGEGGDGDNDGAGRDFARMVTHAERVSLSETARLCVGVRGDGEHLFIVESGALEARFGPGCAYELRRGAYFGAPCEAVMFGAGLLAVTEPGAAFKIPLAACSAALLARWDAAACALYPLVRAATCLQPLPAWLLVTACHTAERRSFRPNETALAPGEPFRGLFVVCRGSFFVLGGGGRAAEGAGGAEPLVLGPGDVFGEEALLARRPGGGTVAVVAGPDSLHDARGGGDAVLLRAALEAPLADALQQLRPVFRVLVRQYAATV